MVGLHARIISFDGRVDAAQVYPFFLYEAELRDRYGFTFTRHFARGAEDILRAGGDEPCDLWFVESRSFGNASFAEKERVLTALRRRAPIVFLDSADSAYGRDFRILHCVDRYVKKQIYRDRGLYQNHYLDGRVFADFLTRANHPRRLAANSRFYLTHLSDGEVFLRFVARSLRKNLAGSAFYGRSTLDPVEAHKLTLGWTVGTQGRLYERFRDQGFLHAQSASRPIDVHCRVTTKTDFFCEWYYYHRQSAIDALQPLKRTYHVVATSQKLPRDQYFDELYSSKIVVSPFGWGEVCYRDFEAVISGSLLVKPSTEHLQTCPNIYEPGRTYVPVRWDLSDLEEKCRYYLEHPAERQQIVRAASTAYAAYFHEKKFLTQMEHLLGSLPCA